MSLDVTYDEDMTIYVIYFGVDYEPGHIGGAFSTREQAEAVIGAKGYLPNPNAPGHYERGGLYAYIEECPMNKALP